jgi:hypothetical protein
MSMGGVQVMACLLLTMVLSAGCALTRHDTNVEKSGFLGEELYAKMTKGDEDKLEPALRWRNEDAVKKLNLTKIILDPIVLYRQPQHMGGGNSNESSQMLINYFYSKLHEGLSKHFELVDKPGPGTMRWQVAITDYEQSWVALDMVSTVVPQLRVVGEAKAKVSDSETGTVLVAAIDRRVGGKAIRKGTDNWADVKNAMDFWALQADYRACLVARKPDCGEMPKP